MQRLHEVQRRGQPVLRYVRPASLQEALVVLAEMGPRAKAVAGGTDLLLELVGGHRPGIDTLVDLSVLEDLATITLKDGKVKLGPLVTHSDLVGWEPIRTVGLPLAQACLEVGSPQLRNRATVVGNLVTASPANDTISALYALNASVTVASADTCERTMPITDFVTGYRSTVLKPGELVTCIAFDALHSQRRGIFVKLGLRRTQAIAIAHAAIVVTTSKSVSDKHSDEHSGDVSGKHSNDEGEIVEDLKVALGSVGSTVVLSEVACEIARGRPLHSPDLVGGVASAASRSVSPIDDLRSTADYRNHVVEVLVRRALQSLVDGSEAATWRGLLPRLIDNVTPSTDAAVTAVTPTDAVVTVVDATDGVITDAAVTDDTAPDDIVTDVADTTTDDTAPDDVITNTLDDDDVIVAVVNGVERSAPNAVSRTLLDWLRMELRLTGTKEGCAEGECGSCTIHLDGKAVLACLVPAARANGSEITTVEGVASPNDLHPVQQSLADTGGVQCGFCTPGFVMSAVMLAKENPTPNRDQVEHALSGNLCRCTGYYSIIEALTSK